MECLEALVRALNAAGFVAEIDGSNIRVLGCTFATYVRPRRFSVSYRRFARNNNGVREALTYVVTSLPDRLAMKERSKTRDDFEARAESVGKHVTFPGLKLTASEKGFHLTLTTDDEVRLMCVIDWIQEFLSE